MTQLLLIETDLTPTQRRYAEMAQEAGRGLLAIINDILDFSKIEAGKLRLEAVDFDLRELVSESLELLRERAGRKGLQVSSRVSEDVPCRVRGDPVRLRQVLINLIDNAVKFTEKGTVEIDVRCAGAADVAGDRRRLRVEVRDTGVGLPPGAEAVIFDAFAQADGSTTRRYGGTGLGLAICKQLVEMMGGEVGVRSRQGEGSTFWIEVALPVPEAAPASKALAAAPVVSPDRLEGEVLLVEDNPVNREVAMAMLSSLGLTARVAHDGREALAMLEHWRPDLVLMDCEMPELDGYETTREIRKSGDGIAGVPVVAITASALVGDRDRCLEAGMNDYLTKPFTRDEFVRILQRWMPPPSSA